MHRPGKIIWWIIQAFFVGVGVIATVSFLSIYFSFMDGHYHGTDYKPTPEFKRQVEALTDMRFPDSAKITLAHLHHYSLDSQQWNLRLLADLPETDVPQMFPPEKFPLKTRTLRKPELFYRFWVRDYIAQYGGRAEYYRFTQSAADVVERTAGANPRREHLLYVLHEFARLNPKAEAEWRIFVFPPGADADAGSPDAEVRIFLDFHRDPARSSYNPEEDEDV